MMPIRAKVQNLISDYSARNREIKVLAINRVDSRSIPDIFCGGNIKICFDEFVEPGDVEVKSWESTKKHVGDLFGIPIYIDKTVDINRVWLDTSTGTYAIDISGVIGNKNE